MTKEVKLSNKELTTIFRSLMKETFIKRNLSYTKLDSIPAWVGKSLDGKYEVGLVLSIEKDKFSIVICYDPDWLFHAYQFITSKLPPREILSEMEIKYSRIHAYFHRVSQVNLPVNYELDIPSKKFMNNQRAINDYAQYLILQLDNSYDEAEKYFARIKKYRDNLPEDLK